MRVAPVLLACLLAGLAVAGCLALRPDAPRLESCDAGAQPGGHVPDCIRRNARAVLEFRVGRAYAEKAFRVNETLTQVMEASCPGPPSGCSPPRLVDSYAVVYDFQDPRRPPARALVELRFWPDGSLVEQDLPYPGLPDCVGRPAECRFPVTAEMAKAAAQEAALQERDCGLLAQFQWANAFSADGRQVPPGTYAWAVANGPCPGEGSHTGHIVYVDANDGTVVTETSYELIVD